MNSWNVVGLFVVILAFVILNFDILRIRDKESMRLIDLKARLKGQQLENLYYKQVISTYDDIREWKHDLMNHINIIDILLKKGDYTEARDYIENIANEINQSDLLINTDNKVLNTVLNLKLHMAKIHSIKVKLDLEIPSLKGFNGNDICSLFSNLMDNAIEAQLKTSDTSKREIFLLIKARDQKLVIYCSNPIFQEISICDNKIQTNKSSVKDHGMGLKIVKKIVQKYDGIYQYRIKGTFDVHIILPLRPESLNQVYFFKYHEVDIPDGNYA